MLLIFLFNVNAFAIEGGLNFTSSITMPYYPFLRVFYAQEKEKIFPGVGIETSWWRSYPYYSAEFRNKKLYFEEKYIKGIFAFFSSLSSFKFFIAPGIYLIQTKLPQVQEDFTIAYKTKRAIFLSFSTGLYADGKINRHVSLSLILTFNIMRANTFYNEEIILNGIGIGVGVKIRR